MDPEIRRNRVAWEAASDKHVREYRELLEEARDRSSLTACETEILRPLLRSAPGVVHLQSGHGLDDIALAVGGARWVVGVDFSEVAVTAAQRRARELTGGLPVCRGGGARRSAAQSAWQGRLPNSFTLLARRPGGD